MRFVFFFSRIIKKIFIFIIGGFLIFLISQYLNISIVLAGASSLSLSISPPIIQVTAQAPANIKTPIIIQNLEDESIELDIIFKPFAASESKNEDSLIFEKVQILDANNPIQSLTLSPKQEKKLFLKIDIPKNETDSEYYFSIQFISKSRALNDNLNYSQILGGVAMNVLLSIGKQNAKAVLQEFSAPLFLEKGPITFTLKIKNTGSHFIAPQGVIVIKNMFGKIVGKIDLLPMNILKDSTRSIKPFWNESFLLGVYTANLNISLSPQGPIFTKSMSFFAIPTQAIIAVLASLIIVLLIYNRIKKRF
ncbi:MAG: hypothetical protein AAB600_03890 [Patescibacteria group bacterium]